jgi:hypothetical protein
MLCASAARTASAPSPAGSAELAAAGLALDQGGDRTGLGAHQEVALPVAGHGPIRDLGRALREHHYVPELGPSLAAAARAAPPALLASATQVPSELAPQRAAPPQLERAVGGLGGNPHRLTVGVAAPQPARGLLGGVLLAQSLGHDPPKLGAASSFVGFGRRARSQAPRQRSGPGERRRPPQRLISRAIVMCARPSARAMWRSDSPRAIAREISSRSARVSQRGPRRRGRRRGKPPQAAR